MKGPTTLYLEKLSLQGDALLHQGILVRQDARRLAQHFRKLNVYGDLCEELEIACERDEHENMRSYRESHGRDPYKWSRYPKDPILGGDLPSIVFSDADFDPTCYRCRDRYKL